MLELKGISKSFGGLRAVDDVSLSLKRGAITGLIGKRNRENYKVTTTTAAGTGAAGTAYVTPLYFSA